MIEYNLTGKLQSFEEGFSGNVSGCSMICSCGKTYYDCHNSYDWHDGELESHQESEDIAVGHSVGILFIYGDEYVSVCDCWHEKANKIINWLDNNSHDIAKYLSREKERISEEAAAIPTVGEGWINMDSAPTDGREIEVSFESGETAIAHFAQDLSGEEQPAFSGWFIKDKRDNYRYHVKPTQWRMIGANH